MVHDFDETVGAKKTSDHEEVPEEPPKLKDERGMTIPMHVPPRRRRADKDADHQANAG